MLHASDDEVEGGADRTKAMVPTRTPQGVGLGFLATMCTCQRQTCLQQFRDCSEAVSAKHQEFQALEPHQKARVMPQMF